MFQKIYCQPMGWVWAEMLLVWGLWSLIGWRIARKSRCAGEVRRDNESRVPKVQRVWHGCNCILALCTVAAILYVTLGRSSGETREVILTPFQSFRDAAAQPEMYRTMLMNVILFLPLGLTFANALPGRWPIWLRVFLTALLGVGLSCFVEWAQYAYRLGRTEMDDVLCNTLGTLLGASTLIWQKK